jgi:hypothetical protein
MQRATLLGIALLVVGGLVLAGAEAQGRELLVNPASFTAETASEDADSSGLFAAAAPQPKPVPPAPAAKGAKPAPKAGEKPPAPEAPPPPPPPAAPRPQLLASLAADRLAVAPNMFGDSYFSPNASLLVFSRPAGVFLGSAELPLASTDRVAKFAENGNTLPHDRVFFLYNHFANALNVDVEALPAGPVHQSLDIDRFTLGFEKTFLDERWSVELRVPLFGNSELNGPDLGFEGDRAGNLAVIVKRLLFRTETSAGCVGLAIDTPTADGFQARFLSTDLTVHNDAVHLMPYVGLLNTPSERLFFQAFLQVDVPTVGERVDSNDFFLGPNALGKYNEQTLLYADLQAGYWLYRNRGAPWLTGLAGVAELHYTAALQDADLVQGFIPGPYSYQVGNPSNRVDMLNMTVGLHAELSRHTLCRVAGVVPLRTGDNRAFDGELQVQLERRF